MPEEAMKIIYYCSKIKYHEHKLYNFNLISKKALVQIMKNHQAAEDFEKVLEDIRNELNRIINDKECYINHYNKKYLPKLVDWFKKHSRFAKPILDFLNMLMFRRALMISNKTRA